MASENNKRNIKKLTLQIYNFILKKQIFFINK